MGVTTTKTNKPFNPRAQDQSPLAYNRAKLYSGKALDFDGVNDLVTMPTALTSSLSTTSVTFVTNVKTDFATWAGTRDDAFSFAERGMILAFNGGNIYYYYRHQSSGWRNLQVPNADFKPQEWNQMVTTIDLNTNTWKAYVNGVEVATSGTYSDTAIAYDANALTIGGQAGARFFDGQIAGFKIFNTALTAAQVADLYNNPEKVVPTGVSNTALKLWLPMMEGAGTTAYDGSGNGNHGTISGATYVNGVGAPVSQSAVMNWNKGTNLQINSEDFTQSNWYKEDLSVTANATTAPDGSNTADKIIANTTNIDHSIYDPITNGTYVHSLFAKAGEYDYIFLGADNNFASEGVFFDLVNGTINQNTSILSATIESFGNGWYRCSVIGNMSYPIIALSENGTSFVFAGDNSSGVYIWGASLEQASSVGPYVRTGATAQTSDVLLPQGLTTGRDITGVNLFENVRKQGALNLDGNSWAEVHDNASLDFGTGSFTLEVWSKAKYISSGSIYNVLLTLGDNVSGGSTSSIYIDSSLNYTFRYDSTLIVAGGSSEGDWSHVVGVYDGTNINIYLNGSFVVQAAASATSKTNDLVKVIGRDSSGNSRAYKDQIAQPRIYNRALTAEEVQRNYNAGKNTYTN